MSAICIAADSAGLLFRLLFVSPPPAEKPPAELAWEDDGGALTVASEGYEHTISAEGRS